MQFRYITPNWDLIDERPIEVAITLAYVVETERDLDATGPFRHFAAVPRLAYPTSKHPRPIDSATSLSSNFKSYRDYPNQFQIPNSTSKTPTSPNPLLHRTPNPIAINITHYDDKDLPSHALPKTMPLPSGKVTPKTYELPSRRNSTIPKRRRPHLLRRPDPLNGVHNGARRQHTCRAMLLLQLCCSTQSPR